MELEWKWNIHDHLNVNESTVLPCGEQGSWEYLIECYQLFARFGGQNFEFAVPEDMKSPLSANEPVSSTSSSSNVFSGKRSVDATSQTSEEMTKKMKCSVDSVETGILGGSAETQAMGDSTMPQPLGDPPNPSSIQVPMTPSTLMTGLSLDGDEEFEIPNAEDIHGA